MILRMVLVLVGHPYYHEHNYDRMMFGPLKSSGGVKNQRNTHNPFAIDFNIGTASQKFNTRNYYSYFKQCTSSDVHVNGAVD